MIQKTIHYCWLGGGEYSDLVKKCIASWHKYLPDYNFVCWDRNKFDIDSVLWVKQAVENKKYAFAADYIRLYALYSEGGIYLDADVEVLKDFSPLLQHHSFMGYDAEGNFEPAIIGAEKELKWVKNCLDYYDGRKFIKQDLSFDTRPLPRIIEETLIKNAELTLYPKEYFGAKSYITKKIRTTNNTYAIHHFTASWHSRKERIGGILIRIMGVRIFKFCLKIFHNIFG
jgi:mannosyltransferase OCH1-like enzyme